MKAFSIRMRLTLWYSSILGITFALLGVGLFYEIRKGLYHELDKELLSRFEKLEPFLNMSMTQFIADASHELRTPVTLIRTAAELSLRNPQTELEYRETLMSIFEEAERTSLLIEGLMILARGDSGSEAILRDQVDLSSTVAGVVRQGKTLAQLKQIDVRSEIPEVPVQVSGNAERLNRLFLILMDNAVKYTPPGGSVHVRVDVKEGCPVVVRDSGVGISSDDMPHIFERFYRADKARSREQGGFGLGLAIAKWIAETHHAEICVESIPARGSIFTVVFRQAASQEPLT